jgi:UDP-N-acetylmuramate--alanine ligase
MVTVVTNIEEDHMDTYGGEFSRLRETFTEFLHNLPFYGLAVVCADDPVLTGMGGAIGRPLLRYGFAEDADYRVVDLQPEGLRTRFTVQRPDAAGDLEILLNMPGAHNVLNATAAVAVATDQGIDDAAIQRSLAGFAGVGRRFSVSEDLSIGAATVILVDDYGHHPTEVAATLASVRQAWPDRRMVMVYQPHRFTRTRDLYDDFVEVLSHCDRLVLLEVYPAGEEPVAGADSRSLARSIRQRGLLDPVYAREAGDVPALLADLVEDGDIVVTQGAGDIAGLAVMLRGAQVSA